MHNIYTFINFIMYIAATKIYAYTDNHIIWTMLRSRKLMDSKHETFTIKITDIVNLILGRDDVWLILIHIIMVIITDCVILDRI